MTELNKLLQRTERLERQVKALQRPRTSLARLGCAFSAGFLLASVVHFLEMRRKKRE